MPSSHLLTVPPPQQPEPGQQLCRRSMARPCKAASCRDHIREPQRWRGQRTCQKGSSPQSSRAAPVVPFCSWRPLLLGGRSVCEDQLSCPEAAAACSTCWSGSLRGRLLRLRCL